MSGFEVARDICLLLLLFVAPVSASLALEGHLASQFVAEIRWANAPAICWNNMFFLDVMYHRHSHRVWIESSDMFCHGVPWPELIGFRF